jgi:CRP/FNR family transcriptional regulator, anaerobic regulatory protein
VFEEGTMLMRPGQYFKSSLIILDGRVKLYREGEDGEEFFLYYLEKGNACALSSVAEEAGIAEKNFHFTK